MGRLDDLKARARSLALSGDWGEEAVSLNTEILSLDANDVSALTRLGRCHEEAAKFLHARAMFLRSLEIDPGNQVASRRLERLESDIPAKEANRILYLLEEIEGFDEAFYAGVKFKRLRQPILAIAALRRALAIEPLLEAKTALAAAYRMTNNPRKAKELYLEVLQEADDSAAKVGLAAVYTDLGAYPEAIEICAEVISDEDNERTRKYALRCMGRAYRLNGHPEAAQACAAEAAEIAEEKDRAIDRLRVQRELYEAQGRPKSAGLVGVLIESLERLEIRRNLEQNHWLN